MFGTYYKERVLELNASDERGIQVIREKVKKFSQKVITKIPGQNTVKFQIVILDEADSMTNDAQSALRRIIEDYTSQTRFCIICNYISKIIDPIASRCAKFRFNPLSKQSQINRLRYITEKEQVVIDDNVLIFLEEMSEGDLRKSINLLQSISQLGYDLISEDVINDVCGIIPKNVVDQLLAVCKKGNLGDVVHYADVFFRGGYDMRQLLTQLNDTISYDNSITERQRQKCCELILNKEISLLNNSSNKITCYDLLSQLNTIFHNE